EQAADGRTNRRPFARITPDGAAHRAHGRAAGGPAKQSALWSAGRRRWCVDLGISGIEPALLHGPAIALPLVELLLLRALTAGGIDEDLCGRHQRETQNERGQCERDETLLFFGHHLSPSPCADLS